MGKNKKKKKVDNRLAVSRPMAIGIVMNVNGVSREVAQAYTDSELREVMRLLRFKTTF